MLFKKKNPSITIPKHMAIILDGNGRWAQKRGLSRTAGHQVGIENIRKVAIICEEMGVEALSVFAFSTENWNRPQPEIDFLMTLPTEFEKKFSDDFAKYDIKVMFSGRRSKLSKTNLEILERITANTKHRTGLILNVCFDYGSYTEITDAVKAIAIDVKNHVLNPEDITPDLITKHLYTAELPPLDLLIRTSGELRLSNFMLWQAAYAEFYFTAVHWPAFGRNELIKAFEAYSRRNRRFGAIKG
jgi:undecaprenyl diphosphate synthase